MQQIKIEIICIGAFSSGKAHYAVAELTSATTVLNIHSTVQLNSVNPWFRFSNRSWEHRIQGNNLSSQTWFGSPKNLLFYRTSASVDQPAYGVPAPGSKKVFEALSEVSNQSWSQKTRTKEQKHIDKIFTESSRDFLGICSCVFSPIRNDPKNI